MKSEEKIAMAPCLIEGIALVFLQLKEKILKCPNQKAA